MDDLFAGNSLSDDKNYDQSCRGSEVLKEHEPPLLFDLVSKIRLGKILCQRKLDRFHNTSKNVFIFTDKLAYNS